MADSLPPPASSASDRTSSLSVIGLTQFVFLALGMMVVNIIVKVSGGAHEIAPLAALLVNSGLWLVLIPIVWMLLARLLVWLSPAPAAQFVAAASGVLVAAGILVVFALAIIFPTV